jgi:hypothetical protein
MSRDFNGTSEYLEYAGAVRTALPITLACWVYKDDNTTLDVALSVSNNGGLNRVGLAFSNISTARVVSINTAGTSGNADTSTTFSANTWVHGAAVIASTTSRTAYLNAGGAVSSTTTINPSASTFNTTNIGCFNNSSGRAQYFGGLIAEAGIWSVALTLAEIQSLAKGVSPLMIRPASLIAYWPLIGQTSPEIDLRGRYEMTVSGAVAGDHPRVYMPTQPFSPRKVTLAASTVPVLYRQRQMQGMAA